MQSLLKKKLLLLLFIININGIEWFEMTTVRNLIFPVLAIRQSRNASTDLQTTFNNNFVCRFQGNIM